MPAIVIGFIIGNMVIYFSLLLPFLHHITHIHTFIYTMIKVLRSNICFLVFAHFHRIHTRAYLCKFLYIRLQFFFVAFFSQKTSCIIYSILSQLLILFYSNLFCSILFYSASVVYKLREGVDLSVCLGVSVSVFVPFNKMRSCSHYHFKILSTPIVVLPFAILQCRRQASGDISQIQVACPAAAGPRNFLRVAEFSPNRISSPLATSPLSLTIGK